MISKRRNRTASLTLLPSRQATSRTALALAVGIVSVSLVLEHTGSQFAYSARMWLDDAIAPVSAKLAQPVNSIKNAGVWIKDTLHISAEPVALKATRAELAQWQAAAKALEAENQSLRKLMHVVPAGASHYIAARMVIDSTSPYVRAALLSAGGENGVRKDAAVISAEGLVGRVIDAGNTSARMLLLTDANSRIPVMGEISRERSILTGDNSGILSLAYTGSHSALSIGERIVTSGDGGIFPAGIPVAVVSSVDGTTVHASPLANWQDTDYVSVVDYTF